MSRTQRVPASVPPSSGIASKRDRLDRRRYRPGSNVGASAQRIRDAQLCVLKGGLINESPLCQTIGSLVLFEGIGHVDDLAGSVANLPHIYRYEDQAMLDWQDADGRQHRRVLSPMTMRLRPWEIPVPSDEDMHAALRQVIGKLYAQPESISKMLSDIGAYLFESLPGAIFAHVSHDCPITALPRSALARHESMQGLQQREGATGFEGATAIGMALDHVFQAPPLERKQQPGRADTRNLSDPFPT